MEIFSNDLINLLYFYLCEKGATKKLFKFLRNYLLIPFNDKRSNKSAEAFNATDVLFIFGTFYPRNVFRLEILFLILRCPPSPHKAR